LYKKFKLEKRNAIFEENCIKSLVFKEGISNGVLEVFDVLIISEIIIIVL
jgi:hypothetical protein